MTIFADAELAERLEGLVASEMRRFVMTARTLEPLSGAEYAEIGGGVAAFVGPGSPVNQAVGLGHAGAVGESEVAEVERFLASRGSRPLLSLCPLAHPSLRAALAARGWLIDGFENVLLRCVDPADAEHLDPAGVAITEVTSEDEAQTWAIVAATGFSAPFDPLPEQLALGRIVAAREGARLLLARVDGLPAATGEITISDGVAWLSADATLPQFRGRGLQQALQRARLRLAAQAGCELAVSEALPGSTSQRNMERLGFRLGYTRIDLVAPLVDEIE